MFKRILWASLLALALSASPALAQFSEQEINDLKEMSDAWRANGDTFGVGGSDITFDLGNDAVNETTALGSIATTGDTNNIFTEPDPNKILIDLTKKWPAANAADTATSATTASVLTYTPDEVTNWTDDADPGDANDALDQLAARMVAIEEGGFLTVETQTMQQVFANGKEITGANSFANAFRVGDGTDGLAQWLDASNGPTMTCYIAGVQGDCDRYILLNADKHQGVKNSSGTIIFQVNSTTSTTKDLNKRSVQIVVTDFTTNTATGDGQFYYRIPEILNGMNLVAVLANVVTAGTTGTTNVDIARCVAAASGNVCSSTVADMLSTNLTIDSGENSSSTAATPAVIDTANDDVATGQLLRIDVDAVHTTPAKGLILNLDFQLPSIS